MHGAELSGLERLRAIIAGTRRAPYGELLGFGPVEADRGSVVFEGVPGAKHYNPQNIVHGGYAASILDSCMGCAIETVLDAGVTYTTVELKINYVRAMTADSGPVRATGRVIHAGRTMATSEGRLEDASGRLMAHGSTTCMILPAK